MYRILKEVEAITNIRENKTEDIVERLGIIASRQIHLRGFPMERPITVFNASGILKENVLEVFARIVIGYYMYISGIVRLEIPLDDVLSGEVSASHYSAEIILTPNVKQDIWGCEDPRSFIIENTKYIVYTGRCVYYFNPIIRKERTLPILAYEVENKWKKICAFVHPPELREKVISDKDAFLVKTDKLFLFHRPHIRINNEEKSYCVVSEIDERDIERLKKEERKQALGEVIIKNPYVPIVEAPFEIKIGWSAPPIEIGKNKYLFILHGVDRVVQAYRAFALLMEYRKDEGFVPVAVTPYYILEPKTDYEVFGDRPLVTFPCGLIDLKDELLIIYGAADTFVVFGLINKDDLLSRMKEI